MDNMTDGYNFYKSCDEKDKQWFLKQWKKYPERVDPSNTINLSFLYGGLKAYIEMNGAEPELSKDFALHVKVLKGEET